jgi:hypothetical protein
MVYRVGYRLIGTVWYVLPGMMDAREPASHRVFFCERGWEGKSWLNGRSGLNVHMFVGNGV